jgi:4-aminobutyrate aminotransferase
LARLFSLHSFYSSDASRGRRDVTEIAERQAQAAAATPTKPANRQRPVPDIRTPLPGPRARQHVAFDHTYTSPSLPRAYPLVPVRGDGATIEDIDGNLFLDFCAGIAVSSTGYAHPRITAAIERQAGQLLHFSASDFYLPVYAELAAELDRIAPIEGPTKSFITNSGTEAVEAAIKLARFHSRRQYIVAFVGAFHGRSYGSVSLTASKSRYHAGFGPLLPGVVHVPFGNAGLDELESRVFKKLVPADEVAAIFVEPIQGEGGYIVPEDDFLARLRKLCDRHGILLVADEVQSGAGRTGRMWALEHWNVEPDIVLTAKGIASGMPLGAMIARAELMTWQAGHHGSTFGGNPVSCAAALETIRLLEEGLIDNAAQRGKQAMDGLRTGLAEHGELVREVRGKGLMIGVEFDTDATAEAVQWACFQRGLLVLEAGESVVRMSPPLIVTADEVDMAVRLFSEAVAAVSRDPGRALHDARKWGNVDEVYVTG